MPIHIEEKHNAPGQDSVDVEFSNDDINAAKNWRNSIVAGDDDEETQETQARVMSALFAANYNREPPASLNSAATHYIYVPPGEGIPNTRIIPPQDIMINADVCVSIYEEQSENSEIVATVRHKSLVVVEEERLYPDGRFHLVTVVDTHPDVDGASGYVKFEDVAALDRTPPSLPMVFDACRTSFLAESADICDIATPSWYLLEEPWLNESACEYWVNVTTNYGGTGIAPSDLENRKQEAIYPGIVELLDYYDKANTEEVVQSYLSAFRFARATSWYLDEKSRYSRLQVLVIVPAKYFDAIPKRDIKLEDIEGSDNGVARVAVFDSSLIGAQIKSIVRLFKGYENLPEWQAVRDFHFGPDQYPVFDFSWEAVKLDRFLSILTRFLILNGYSLRETQRDRIEIGFDDSYTIKYIFLDFGEGSIPLRVGLNKLISADPFNSRRTMAYVFNLYEIDARAKTTEGSLTWRIVLDEYTNPPPNFYPSADPAKKCKPTLFDPYRCTKLEFGAPYKKSLFGHLTGCGIKQKGESLVSWEKQAGDAGSPSAPMKTEDAVKREDEFFDKKKLQKQDNANKNAKLSIVTPHEGEDLLAMGGEVLIKLLKDLFACGCAVLDETYEELLAKDDMGAAMATRAAYVGVGCEDLCKVFPIVCGLCIPPFIAQAMRAAGTISDAASEAEAGTAAARSLFNDIAKTGVPGFGSSGEGGEGEAASEEWHFPWPPKIPDIPELPTEDIMEFVMQTLKAAMIAAIRELLFMIFKAILDKIRFQCPVPRLRSPAKEMFLGEFDKSIPPIDFEEAGTPYEQEQRIKDNLIRNDIRIGNLDPARVNEYIREISLLLNPSEFCELIQNSADYNTLSTVERLTKTLYPDIYAHFSTIERLRHFFSSVGDMVDGRLCDKVLQLADTFGEDDIIYPDSLCTPQRVRSDILDGRVSEEQAKEQLLNLAECQTNQLHKLKSFINSVASGGDFFDGAIGPLLSDGPGSPGLIPRDPPSIQFLNDETTDALFDPVVHAFNSDMEANIPTMITTITDPTPPNNDRDPASWVFAQMGLPRRQSPQSAQTISYVADNIREKLITGTYLKPGPPENLTNIINIEFPERSYKNKEQLDQNPLDVGSDFIAEGFAKGAGISDSAWKDRQDTKYSRISTIKEKRHLSYDVCTANSMNWQNIRDKYSIVLGDNIDPGAVSNTLIAYSGEKTLQGQAIPMGAIILGTLPQNGAMPTPALAFNNIMAANWLTAFPGNLPLYGTNRPITATDILSNADRNLFRKFHEEVLFETVTQDIMKKMSQLIAASKLLSTSTGAKRDSNQFTSQLAELQLVPDPICGDALPGLLNIPAVRSNVSKLYQASTGLTDRERYVESAAYGLVELYVRVFIIEIVVDAIFVATQFRTQDIFGSEAFVKYLLYRLRRAALEQEPEFFIDMLIRVQKNIHRRTIMGEKLKDPFTGQEVLVTTPITEMMPEEEFGAVTQEDLFKYGSSIYRGTDDLTGCSQDDDENDEDCEEISEDLEDAQMTDGAEDQETGLPSLGYFEFFIKENLKSVADEFEVKAGTQVFSLDNYALSNFFPTVDVPAHRRAQRFIKNVELATEDITEVGLRARGLNSAAAAYAILETVADTNITLAGFLLGLNPNARAQEKFDEARAILAEGGLAVQTQDQLTEFLLGELRRSFVTEEKKSDLIKDEFQELIDGGFILERFIKVTDYAEDSPEWQRLSARHPESVGIIQGRRPHLKGIVNIRAWEEWISQTLTAHHEKLGMFTEVNGQTSINVPKYWANWEYGLRLVYVYPLVAGNPISREEIEEHKATGVQGSLWDIAHQFKNEWIGGLALDSDQRRTGRPLRSEISEREKAYILSENLTWSAEISVGDENPITVHAATEEVTGYRILTTPVITELTPVRPEDVKTLGRPSPADLVIRVIEAFETAFYSSFRQESLALFERHRQLYLEPHHPDKVVQEEWCISGYKEYYGELLPGGDPEVVEIQQRGDNVVVVGPSWVDKNLRHTNVDWSRHELLRLRGTTVEQFNTLQQRLCTEWWELNRQIKPQLAADEESGWQPYVVGEGALGKFQRIRGIYDRLLVSSEHIQANIQDLGEIKDHGIGLVYIQTLRDIMALYREFLATPDSRSITPIVRCFGPGNDETFENRRFDTSCAEYDKYIDAIREIDYYLAIIEGADPPPPINIKFGYDNNAINILKSNMKESDEFKSLFEYIFPMKRFLALLTIYNAEYIGGLPGRREMFDRTKGIIRTLQGTLLGTLNRDWWREKPPRGKEWWERPLAVPVPMIILMTPLLLLRMLLTLVPPLDWFLGALLDSIPELPPHRSKKNKTARCLPPASTASREGDF